jgi:hypothetical protein
MKNQNGFSLPLLPIVVLMLAAGVAAGYVVFHFIAKFW